MNYLDVTWSGNKFKTKTAMPFIKRPFIKSSPFRLPQNGERLGMNAEPCLMKQPWKLCEQVMTAVMTVAINVLSPQPSSKVLPFKLMKSVALPTPTALCLSPSHACNVFWLTLIVRLNILWVILIQLILNIVPRSKCSPCQWQWTLVLFQSKYVSRPQGLWHFLFIERIWITWKTRK